MADALRKGKKGGAYDQAHPSGWIRQKTHRIEQCLCCKIVIGKDIKAFIADRPDNPNWICVQCHSIWNQNSDIAMYQLPTYIERGRLPYYKLQQM